MDPFEPGEYNQYVVLDDISGTRATVCSVHHLIGEAYRAAQRLGPGVRVAGVPDNLGTPAKGERVWYARDKWRSVVQGRA